MATLTQSRGRTNARRTRKVNHNQLNTEVANTFPPELQYEIDRKEYDYMGYNGCEALTLHDGSGEVQSATSQQKLTHLGHNLNYAYRAKLQNDLKVRLFLVKKECDLIPPMENVQGMVLSDDMVAADGEDKDGTYDNEVKDEVTQMVGEIHHQESVERSRDDLDEEEERARLEAEKAEAEHQLKLQEEANELERLRRLREEEEAEKERQRALFEEETKILQSCERSETEINKVEETLDTCIRALLSVNENGYFVSYLDGTRRHTLEELDNYNTSTLDKIRTELKEKDECNEALADDEVVQEFSTVALHEYMDKYINTLKVLYRFREEHEDNQGIAEHTNEEATKESAEKKTEEDLQKEVDESYALLSQTQDEYNERATKSYRKILSAINA